MIVYLLRHGIAEDIAEGGDARRSLTRQGTFQVAMMAKGLRKLGLTFDSIIASPFDRARETAEIIARITEFGGEIGSDARLLPMAEFADVSQLITEQSHAGSVLFVGHQPAIGRIIGELSAEGALDIDVEPASIRATEIHRLRPLAHGTLLWSLTPQLVEGIMSS